MKSLFTFCLLVMTLVVQAQFTANRLVVSRVGNGSTALSVNTAPVSLLEFTTAGAPGTSVNLGSSMTGSQLTLSGISAAATTLEGQLSLSQDGNYVSLAGYDVPAGELSTSTGISAIAVTTGGSGYSFSSVITISGGGGTGATAVMNNVVSGAVSSIRITNAGSGYTSTPTVTITGGAGGAGAGTGFVAGAITRVPYWQGVTSNKVVARFNASAIPDYSTSFPNSFGTVGSIKQAVTVDGSKYWVAGNRIEYVAFGQTSQAAIAVNASVRSSGIFQSQLFYDLGFNSGGLLATVTPLPEVTSTGTSVIGMDAATSSPGPFVFLDTRAGGDSRGFDVCYIAEINAGLEKHYYNGSAWVPVNSKNLPIGAALNNPLFPTTSFSSITARIENGEPVIYAVSGTGTSTNNSIYVIKDNAGYNQAMVLGTNTVATNLVSAGANFAFRGIAFTPGSDLVAIPVELMTFKGSLIHDKANLQWITASERNAKEFIVEKSTNGKEFNAIGTVAAKNSAVKSNYTFDDAQLSEDINYYRLKMMDFDGSYKYSPVVAIKLGGKGVKGLSVFPNPVANTLTIDHTAAADDATIRIFSLAGSSIIQYNVAKNATQTSVDASQLPAGQYFINYISKGMSVTTSFVK